MTTTPVEMTEQEELAQENARMAEANAAINEIQAKRAGRQRAVDIKLLEGVRNELSERQSFAQKYNPVFRQQEQDYANARNHVLAARVDVAESQRRMPSFATYLPDDAEVQRWRKHHDQLLERLANAQAAFDALPDPERLRQELAQVTERIIVLSYSVDNLVRKLEGWSGKTWLEGGSGVSNVGGGTLPSSGKAWIR